MSTLAYAASPSKAVACRAQSEKMPAETEFRWPGRGASQAWTSWPGASYGSARSSTASTTPYMAVFAPMPSPSVSTAATVKPGAFSSCRNANLRSPMRISRRPEAPAAGGGWRRARRSPRPARGAARPFFPLRPGHAGPGVVVGIERLLRRPELGRHVLEVDADPRPGGRAAAHRIDEHVRGE